MRQSMKPVHVIPLILLAGALAAYEGRSADDDKLSAQQSGAGQAALSVIRVESNLVSVPVSVTDAAGHVVRDLGISAEDLSLL